MAFWAKASSRSAALAFLLLSSSTDVLSVSIRPETWDESIMYVSFIMLTLKGEGNGRVMEGSTASKWVPVAKLKNHAHHDTSVKSPLQGRWRLSRRCEPRKNRVLENRDGEES